MQPKLLRKTSLGAQYVVTKFNGKNESGKIPIGDTVLVLCDESVDKTEGGIILTDDHKERNKMAAETGVVVAFADGAWKWTADRTRLFEGRRPNVGERVSFQRYSGQLQIGRDGLEYRLMTDSCIACIDVDDDLKPAKGN